jgi:hypothetical protein
VVFAACSKDFLNKPPIGTLNPQIMATEAGVQGLLIGAYSLVDGEGASGDGFASGASNWTYGGVAADEANKGSIASDVAVVAPFEDWVGVNSTNGAVPQKWALVYAGMQRCNDAINTERLANLPDSTVISAQARFIRAIYGLEAQKVFGNIVYADESVNPQNIAVTNTDMATVWQKLEADLQFAVDNLPDNWSNTGEVGRANKSAAKAMLAKAYLFDASKGYSAAYPLLQDIIASGQTSKGDHYALESNFYSNFNPAQKNGPESVFAAQTSVQDGSSVDWGGDPNGNYGDILNFPYTGGPGACCGFDNPTQDLADAYKTDANGLPLLDPSGNWIGYQGNHVSDPTTPYVGTLDPRIDWTMGRKGIPYLDWGPHPGDSWIRDPINDGHFSPKKDVYAASQKNYTDVGSAYWGPTELTANNVNLIRFSDVLLWAAECAANANDLSTAMTYVNEVRSRVKDHPETWVYANSAYDAPSAEYTDHTTPADNYKIGLYTSFPSQAYAMSAIQLERRLELAMEGHRFFDLVRWGTADAVLNAYYDRYRGIYPLKADAHWAKGKNEYFPIPQGEIDNMNSDGTTRLTQNPGY